MKKINRLRFCLVILVMLLVFIEAPVAFRLFLLNSEIAQNERLNYGPAHEEYVETYYELQSEKAEVKSEHWLASLPFVLRLTVYTVTVYSIFILIEKIKKEKVREKAKKERRKLRYEKEEDEQQAEIISAKSPVRVDIAKFLL